MTTNTLSGHGQDAQDGAELVPDLVAQQAAATPERIAIQYETRKIKYEELDSKASALSRELQARGAEPDVPVGLCLERSPEFIIGALAAWKAGAPYLPLDPSLPPERIRFMLTDAQARFVITCTTLRHKCEAAEQILVDTPNRSRQSGPTRAAQAQDLAYIIYTSGSTGAPKGVEITQANLLNLVRWHNSAFEIGQDDHGSHVAGLGFDAAVWEIWPYLACGACVHIAADCIRTSSEHLREWVVREGVTVSFWPTALAEIGMDLTWPDETRLRYLLTGGDALRRFAPAGLPFRVINNYGPTETTVVATSALVPTTDTAPRPLIGSSIANVVTYVLDNHGAPVADGQIGELYIAGRGVGRGYRNRPELTRDRFLPDPFAGDNFRMYRTGDMVRRRSDGQLDFLGRMDQQLKIRGYRIEPEEVATTLSRHPAVQMAAVTAFDIDNEKQLAAYVVFRGPTPTRSELQKFMSDSLPSYMVPSIFVTMTALPMTANGKVDLRSLPDPAPSNTLSDEVFSPAQSTTEAHLAALIAELLRVPKVGRNDNFFLLGGHSLLGAQLIARVRDRFSVNIPLRNLFLCPTVAGLSAEIDRRIAAYRSVQLGSHSAA